MLRTGYQPLLPLLMHHVISGASMSWIACCVPRAVWYTCILQMSEATVPVNNLVTLWEWRGAHDRPSYTLLRWLLPASKAANSPDPMVREGTLVSQAAARRVAADAAPPHRILPRACSAGRGAGKERGSVERTKGGLASRCRSTASGAA